MNSRGEQASPNKGHDLELRPRNRKTASKSGNEGPRAQEAEAEISATNHNDREHKHVQHGNPKPNHTQRTSSQCSSLDSS